MNSSCCKWSNHNAQEFEELRITYRRPVLSLSVMGVEAEAVPSSWCGVRSSMFAVWTVITGSIAGAARGKALDLALLGVSQWR